MSNVKRQMTNPFFFTHSTSLRSAGLLTLEATRQDSEFNALLGPYSGVEGVLYFPHLGYQVCGSNQSFGRIPARYHDVQGRLGGANIAKLLKHFFKRKHSIAEHI